MSRFKVFVTRRIPEEGLAPLRERYDVEVNPEDRILTREELLAGVRRCDALLCLLTDRIDAEVMDANPGLRVISNYAVGYNNIDVDAATRRRIPVTNTPGVLTETTADMAWALMMAVARRVVEGDRWMRSGTWPGWGPLQLLGQDIYGKVLGIVGFGRIGQAAARRARGFQMQVIYYSRQRKPDAERELGAVYRPLDQLLQEADYVQLHVPLTPETHHLIGERELNLMKPTAYLINTSRGPVIDEQALVRALAAGRIAGAGLDVYEEEPKMAPGLAELDNVVLAPHLGSATRETRGRMAAMAAANLIAVLEGRRPPHLVNPAVYEA